MLQFEDPRDADDAIYGRDGYDFDGQRLRVGGSCMSIRFPLFERWKRYLRSFL
jgi:hypothetical protein